MPTTDPSVTPPGGSDRAAEASAEAEHDLGGDAVCWLSRVCEECGALVEGVGATPCWRCGTVLARD